MASVMDVVLAVMTRRWEWGVADCCTAPCDVFARLHGVDPMASLRGVYSSRSSAEIVITGMGGMVAMAERLAARAGLRDGIGGEGEIGVSGERPEGRVLCICVGDAWAAKTARGFALIRGVDRAWACPKL